MKVQALKEMQQVLWLVSALNCARATPQGFTLVTGGGQRQGTALTAAVPEYPASPAGGRSGRWDPWDGCSSQPLGEQGSPSGHAALQRGSPPRPVTPVPAEPSPGLSPELSLQAWRPGDALAIVPPASLPPHHGWVTALEQALYKCTCTRAAGARLC